MAAAAAWSAAASERDGEGGGARGAKAVPGAIAAPQVVAIIPDERVDWLAQHYHPRKVTYATVEWVELPALTPGLVPQLLKLDAVVFVVRAFDPEQAAVAHPQGRVDPAEDFRRLWQEWLLLDWAVVENRLERLRSASSVPRAQRRSVEQEVQLLERCRAALESGSSLRRADLDEAQRASLRGYSLVTFLPTLLAVNIDDGQRAAGRYPGQQALQEAGSRRCEAVVEVSARLERELAELDARTRQEFMRELGIEPPVGVQRLAAAAYEACELISFLTAGEQEVRAWTIRRGTVARDAAGKVHSDMARGFIRAEVVAFEDLKRLGSLARAREAGLLRLEGKEYVVQDGDVIEFRFNV